MTENPRPKDLAIAAGIIGTSFLPIFRSGGRTGLTFGGWVVNHTVFGPPVEYVPSEDYARELEGVKIMQAYNQPVALALAELRDIKYWNPISGSWESTPPTFSADHWGGLSCRGVNLTDQSRYMWMTFRAYDPGGNFVDYWETDMFTVNPGEGFAAGFSVYCDKPGDYSVTCELYLWDGDPYTPKASVSRVIAHVTAVEEVAALIDTWWLWDAVESDWVRPSPTLIPLGENIGIRGRCKNASGFTIDMRLDAVTHSPSGKTRHLTGSVERVVAGLYPSDYPYWDFIWAGDELGDWKADLILYAARPGASLVEVDRRENIAVAAVQEVAPPPEYKGTITKKQLEYDGAQGPIPVSNIPQGASALIRVTGRNDTPDAQRMGITWMVYDPLGGVVNQYAAWEDWPFTGGYKEHEFHKFGGEFTLSEEGEYTTEIWLLMNPDDPVTVDSYEGVLCTVVKEVIPPECAIDADCPEGYACVAGKCVLIPPECTIDADCPEGYLCVAGKCVPEEEVEKKFPWAPVAIGAGALVAVIGVATAAKKGKR